MQNFCAGQFWDKNHLVAQELTQQKDIQWGSSPPVFFGGAVVDVADSVHQKLSQFERPQSLTNDGPAVDVAPDAARQLSELSRGSR